MKKLPEIKIAYSAKLYNCGGDLNKQWFVYFYFLNPQTNKLERIRTSEGFAQHKTSEEKTLHAQRLIEDINQKLKNGWNPFKKEYVLYRIVDDLTIYQSNLLTFHLETVLERNKPYLRKKSYQSYQSHLRCFFDWLDKNSLSDLTVTEFNKDQAKQFLSFF